MPDTSDTMQWRPTITIAQKRTNGKPPVPDIENGSEFVHAALGPPSELHRIIYGQVTEIANA